MKDRKTTLIWTHDWTCDVYEVPTFMAKFLAKRIVKNVGGLVYIMRQDAVQELVYDLK